MFHGSLYPSCKVQYTLARVYTQFNPRKKPSTLHIVSFLPDFQAFRCEGLDFQVFTLAVNACEGLKNKAFTLNLPENQCFQCEGLGFQSIHTVPEAFTIGSFREKK